MIGSGPQVKFPLSPSKLAVCKAQADEVEEAGGRWSHDGFIGVEDGEGGDARSWDDNFFGITSTELVQPRYCKTQFNLNTALIAQVGWDDEQNSMLPFFQLWFSAKYTHTLPAGD